MKHINRPLAQDQKEYSMADKKTNTTNTPNKKPPADLRIDANKPPKNLRPKNSGGSNKK